MDATSALDTLVDDSGVPIDQITVPGRVDGIPVKLSSSSPAVAWSFPRVSSTKGVLYRLGERRGRMPPSPRPRRAARARVRRRRSGRAGPGPVNSIVDEAPVRTETGGSGESTVMREPATETGGGTGHPADGGGGSSAGGSIGGDGSSASHTGGSDMPAANEPTPAAASGSSGSDTGSTQSGYTTLDGKPYTPWTSHDQVAQFTDAEPTSPRSRPSTV